MSYKAKNWRRYFTEDALNLGADALSMRAIRQAIPELSGALNLQIQEAWIDFCKERYGVSWREVNWPLVMEFREWLDIDIRNLSGLKSFTPVPT